MSKNSICRAVVTLLLLGALPLAAQEPTPAPAVAPNPTPAAMPAPAAAPFGTVVQQNRRGWFGISLSCEECFVQRGPARVAYAQAPAINSVESGSPAWQAGMRTGDTLVSIDGQEMTSPEGFERFANAVPGQQLRVGLRRQGQSREVSLTPIANPQATSAVDFYNSRLRIAQRSGYRALQGLFRQPLGWLGMAIDCEQCSVNVAPRRGNFSFRQAPAVYSVDAEGPAVRAGIHRGDTLTAIDGVDLTDPAGGRAFAQVEPGQHVNLTVRRDGHERRVMLVAVARPDATADELHAYDEYKRMRDSSDAQYKEVMAQSVARAQEQVTELQRALRDLETNKSSLDSSRRRLVSIDSVLRALRNLERQRLGDEGFGSSYSYAMTMPLAALAPSAPMAGMTMPPMPPGYAGRGVTMTGPFPLRYSGRLKDVANVEVRSIGAPSISEVGDSLIVVTVNGAEVKVQLRQR
ncbi:MAG TPA: PDZ domain-containing protein [Gemmatimonadales bacterium]